MICQGFSDIIENENASFRLPPDEAFFLEGMVFSRAKHFSGRNSENPASHLLHKQGLLYGPQWGVNGPLFAMQIIHFL